MLHGGQARARFGAMATVHAAAHGGFMQALLAASHAQLLMLEHTRGVPPAAAAASEPRRLLLYTVKVGSAHRFWDVAAHRTAWMMQVSA